MNDSSKVSRVVVVGGGVFGVSSAVHLARLGIPTALVTDGPPANGASGRSLSWLNSARKRSDAYHRLRMIGIDRYRTLAARNPNAPWLHFDGGLTWDADDAENEIQAVFAHEKVLGYDALWLQAKDVDATIPGVDARSIPRQGAIFNPGEGWVDLSDLIGFLLTEFQLRGGQLITNAGKASVRTANGRAVGVDTESGRRFEADAVLLAAGAECPKMVARVGVSLPDDTPISLLVRTKPVEHALRAVLNTPRVAVRPTPTRALVLDAGWSEKEIVIREDGFEVKASTIAGLLEEATKVLAGNPKLELDSYGAGPKPIPEGGQPVLGPLENIPGYYVAFSHSGATLGLIAGELLAGEIATGEPHPLLAEFRPGRFAKTT